MKKRFLAFAGAVLMLPLTLCFNKNAGSNDAQAQPQTKPTLAVVETPKVDTVPAVPFSTMTDHWVDQNGVPTLNARALTVYLQNAAAHGLNPADYKTDQITQLMMKPSIPADERAAFEDVLTKAFVAYVADMSGPRVSPTLIGSRTEYWRKPLTKADAFAKVDAANGSVNQMLKSLEPKDALYAALKKELATLGSDTSATAPGKMQQVVANMERLRWDLDRPTRFIEANLAANTLRAVDGTSEIDIHIINGRVDRQTDEFTAPITGIRFNPTWHVPTGIMLKDKVPKLRSNPHAFDASGFNYFYDGKKVNPGSINWHMSNAEIAKHVSITQSPGEKNALGHLFSLMQNPYTQFLHYTNQPELFEKDPRFLSSGCMRMEDPDTIAAFILQKTKEEIAAYKGGRGDWNVNAPQPVTFFSVYRSITLDANGALVYHKDTYGRDKKIYDALKAKGKLPAAVLKTNVAQSKPQGPKKA